MTILAGPDPASLLAAYQLAATLHSRLSFVDAEGKLRVPLPHGPVCIVGHEEELPMLRRIAWGRVAEEVRLWW